MKQKKKKGIGYLHPKDNGLFPRSGYCPNDFMVHKEILKGEL